MFWVAGENPQPPALSDNPVYSMRINSAVHSIFINEQQYAILYKK